MEYKDLSEVRILGLQQELEQALEAREVCLQVGDWRLADMYWEQVENIVADIQRLAPQFR